MPHTAATVPGGSKYALASGKYGYQPQISYAKSTDCWQAS